MNWGPRFLRACARFETWVTWVDMYMHPGDMGRPIPWREMKRSGLLDEMVERSLEHAARHNY